MVDHASVQAGSIMGSAAEALGTHTMIFLSSGAATYGDQIFSMISSLEVTVFDSVCIMKRARI